MGMQKLTSQQAPSTCSLEKGLVKTFDNVKYEYSLNDCEHIIFKDCSQSSRVEVLAKTIFSPFIKFESNKKSQYKSQEYEGLEKYIFTFKVHPLGKKLSLYVKSKESEFSIENIRVPMELQGLLPLNVINSHTTNIMQKLTSQQAPSTCSLEKGLVKTFDNVKYEYSL